MKITFPYVGGYVDNPLKNDEVANYLATTWLKESAIWSAALVTLMKKALKKHIYDNDQHMEGVINNVKVQPDRKMVCDEPALYFHGRWKDDREANRTFTVDLEKMAGTVSWRKGKARKSKVLTKDARENEAFMKENSTWDKGRRGLGAQQLLQLKLYDIFKKQKGSINYSYWHDKMTKEIREAGVGDMKGMGYHNFRNWMNGKNGKDRLISESAMKGMQHFVEIMEGN